MYSNWWLCILDWWFTLLWYSWHVSSRNPLHVLTIQNIQRCCKVTMIEKDFVPMLFSIFMVFSRWKTLVDSMVRITLSESTKMMITITSIWKLWKSQFQAWHQKLSPAQQLHQGVIHKVIRSINKCNKDLQVRLSNIAVVETLDSQLWDLKISLESHLENDKRRQELFLSMEM